ncbi:MAG: hypothetical protein HYX92_18990 [Chloroflexi bacterium]|nr:hypothetical protein [Chloroflexota bacterium]
MAEALYEVVWPLGKAVYEPLPLAKRADDLSGRTICELWDWLFKGDQIFSVLRKLLSERYPGVKFVDYNVFGNTHSRKERELMAALPGMLREHGCDAVISAVGS